VTNPKLEFILTDLENGGNLEQRKWDRSQNATLSEKKAARNIYISFMLA